MFICAHDMGTSVATELFARDIAGELGFEAIGALLFNGSMILELAQPDPRPADAARPARAGRLAAHLGALLQAQFGSIFSPEHPLTDAEEADQWSLITHNGGHHLGHRLVRYMDEREIYAERWHGAIRDWAGRCASPGGCSTRSRRRTSSAGCASFAPAAAVTEFADLGHYPQLEDPPG